jgi:purine-binding chemotaxis protein CheW
MLPDFTDLSILPRTLGLADDAAEQEERERRELLIVRAGARLLGVFADEAGGVTKWREPTPLPRAPVAVLGVVSIRGLMLTVLDPLRLLGGSSAPEEGSPRPAFIVALRGDEQLALAVDHALRIEEIFIDEIEPLARRRSAEDASVLSGVIQSGSELVAVLDTGELFAAAMRGGERRRQRT